jgi:hypothetical protein
VDECAALEKPWDLGSRGFESHSLRLESQFLTNGTPMAPNLTWTPWSSTACSWLSGGPTYLCGEVESREVHPCVGSNPTPSA